ncbi:MAG: hypothetical protein JSV09_08895 [Thermoplasmata archaeon]|nr:MAG: hypothetical protein JSV09_08895 [Thermoplasmata archaeon]
MAKQETVGFPSLEKTEDQIVLAAFVSIFLSLYFGLQSWTFSEVLWAGTGIAAFVCIYFAFPNMWPYGILLYAIYGICAFGVILLVFWYDAVEFIGISLSILVGIFLIASSFYIVFFIIKQVKNTRDLSSTKENYLPLGFWSISVILFAVLSILSILSWSLWVNSGQLQFYILLESLIAFLLIYILWIPERNIDWSEKSLPQSPATKFISGKSKALKEKVLKVKNVCPECGSKLKLEKKTCPSCNNLQTFGWCVTSEAYVLPCSHCQEMALYGKENCDKCGKALSDNVVCNKCKSTFLIKEWVAQT